MRCGVLVLVVAHLLTGALVSSPAAAEKSPAKTKAAIAQTPTQDEASAHSAGATHAEDIDAEALALGQPALRQPAAATSATTPTAATSGGSSANTVSPVHVAPSSTTVAAPAGPTVASPTLAMAAVISDGVRTTAVVDIRLLPKRLPYKGEQAVDGYVLEERRRWWMIIAGGVLFGVGYAAAIVAGNDHGFDNGLGFSAIPVAGPWVALAMHDDHCIDDATCSDEDTHADTQLAVGGLLQAAGAVLLPIGLFSQQQVWLRKDLAVSVSPTRIGRSGYGAVLHGSF